MYDYNLIRVLAIVVMLIVEILAVFQVLIFLMQKAAQIVRQLFEHNAALLCQRFRIHCRDLVHNHSIYINLSMDQCSVIVYLIPKIFSCPEQL